jgi:hypothetical protein
MIHLLLESVPLKFGHYLAIYTFSASKEIGSGTNG